MMAAANDAMGIVIRMCERGFSPRHVMEVGAYQAETAHSKQFIVSGARVELVEPQASALESIRAAYGHCPNVTIHPVAIADESGSVLLVSRGASSHTVNASETPAGSMCAGDAAFETVPAVRFDSIDDGTIDLLFCDIEGAEWKVISRMKSLPEVIVVETHGHRYLNPRIMRLVGWLVRRGYRLAGHDAADTVWARGRTCGGRGRVMPWVRWGSCIMRILARKMLRRPPAARPVR